MAPDRYSYFNFWNSMGSSSTYFLLVSWLALLLFFARGRRTNRPLEQATAVKTWRTLPLVVEAA